MEKRLRIAVLLSGSGTTLQNLIERIELDELPVEIAVVVSSRADAYGLERARRAKIPAVAVPSIDYKKAEDHSAAVTRAIARYSPELVVMAGYMCYYHIPKEFEGRVMNVHPALIPAFCGKGLYGHFVHEKVLEYGVKVTGCTVHFVDAKYDHGPIILQRVAPVSEGDTPETLAERVQAEERIAYPEAIRLYAEKRLKVDGCKVHILPGEWMPTSCCGLR